MSSSGDREVRICTNAGCGRRYSVAKSDPERAYRCQRCGARLAQAPDGDARESEPELTALDISDQIPMTELSRESTILTGDVPRSIFDPNAKTFGRYTNVEEIGRGGMGAIYRAIDPELKRAVAIKVGLFRHNPGSHAASKFLLEAEVTGRLAHPNIVPVHELGRTAEGEPYFVMKLVQGRSMAEGLRELARDRASYARKRVSFLADFVKIVDAVAYAHSMAVIHRDLKPANVMVGEFGEVLVMDWGLAKLRNADCGSRIDAAEAWRGEGELGVTAVGTVMGTPAYMAPEQAAGEIEKVDEKSDIYSLGAILYEILTLTPPFAGKLVDRLVDDANKKRLEPPSERAPWAKIPRELDAAVARAMALRPQDRYPSALDLKRDVEAYLQGYPIAALSYNVFQHAAKWIRRNPLTSAVAGMSLAVILAFVVGLALALARAKQAEAEAERRANAEARQREDVLRLSEQKPVDDLVEPERLAEAWRGYPGNVAALEEWKAESETFVGRLPYHRGKLEEIDSKGTLDTATLWQKEHREKLVAKLEELERELGEVDLGLARARELAARLRGVDREAWDEAHEAGLDLAPAPGIVPIGRDAASGLWEFWHIGSGSKPQRGPDGKIVISEDTGIVLVLVPAGRFRMGDDTSPNEREKPAHDVAVREFLLSKFEMTQAQWKRVTAGKEPSNYRGKPTRSVEQVSWADCVYVLSRLGLALPTEAQWEYAARAGTDTTWWTGNDKTALARAGNVADETGVALGLSQGENWVDGAGPPAPVGSYLENPFGLADTIGNVFEWCEDIYHEDYRGAHADDSAWVEGGGSSRVGRGGCFSFLASEARSAARYRFGPSLRDPAVGVRPARSIAD